LPTWAYASISPRKISNRIRARCITLQDGPFSELEGDWSFIPLGDDACKIEFRLQYVFSSRVLETLLAPVFSHITNSFVDAFVRRADVVYAV